MFPSFVGEAEKVFYKNLLDGAGGVRSSLAVCMELFAIERLAKDKEMYLHFRAVNERQNAKRQNDDKVLSS